ncbi:hypothetical protein CFC21_089906 [Triticum aestivum]|uniref:Uncharacterized protein n=2 Tax=Triticum aestivum TaxID=4565 RepID=A0A3B6PS10_WHEAT|nr:hypothetical protein CFC21_089906 [Triticum aestivum]
MPQSVFAHRSLSPFFPNADACHLDGTEPLTARRGLLLVRLSQGKAAGYQYGKSVVRLAVCNLLAGVCEVLPLLCGHLNFTKSGYAIITSADCSSSAKQQSLQPGYSTFFKVLIIGSMKFGPPSLYTFSSSETTYSETYEDPQLAVTAKGTPLVLLLSRPGLQLKVCTRQDGRKSENGAIAKATWLTTHIIELKPPSLIKRRPEKIYLRLLGEKSGTMLLKDSQRQIYIADLETGVMEQFELPDGFDGLNRLKVVLLEMDWQALFVSRLGKW